MSQVSAKDLKTQFENQKEIMTQNSKENFLKDCSSRRYGAPKK